MRAVNEICRPQTSGVWIRDDNMPETTRIRLLRQPIPRHRFILVDSNGPFDYEFIPVSEHHGNGNGRYTGVLMVDANPFSRPGAYQFCYANAEPRRFQDYHECTLFTLARENGLIDAFGSFTLQNETPFDDISETFHERIRSSLS